MLTKDLQKIIKLASETENTKELGAYWQNRYASLFDKNEIFRLSDKTIQLLKQKNVDNPATPFGEIVLVNHLDSNNSLDEIKLQNTVETAVRFLDALIDKVDFSKEAYNIVKKYRKIGLGIADFNEYLKTQQGKKELDEIDYVGHLISTVSYRASESLAEEKGVCQNWEKIHKHLRAKSFEYWQNVETGRILNGIEIKEKFGNQEAVDESSFEIVPRRNSNILLFPPDQEWQIWSDRDETAPKTVIDKSELKTEEKPFEEKKEEATKQEFVKNPFASKPVNNKAVKKDDDKKQSLVSEFQPGELAKFVKENDPKNGNIYQVAAVDSDNGSFRYKIQGDGQEFEALENNLEIVELGSILNKVNQGPEIKEVIKEVPVEVEKIVEVPQKSDKTSIRVFARGIILKENQVLVVDKDEKVELPGTKIYEANNIEKTLLNYLEKTYGISAKIVDEVGTSTDPENNIINIGYLLNAEDLPYQKDFVWRRVDDKNLPQNTTLLIKKHKRRQQIVENLKADLERKVKTVEKELQERILQNEKTNIYSTHSKGSTPNVVKKITKNNHMSKYILKLERLIKTNTFGDILVTIQYDPEGPKVVLAQSESVKGELQQTLNSFLDLINFTLASGIAPSSIANRIEKIPSKGPKLPINDLLYVVAAALKEAPGNVEKIDPHILKEVSEDEEYKKIESFAGPETTFESTEKEDVQPPKPEKKESPKSLSQILKGDEDDSEDENDDVPEIKYDSESDSSERPAGFSFNPFSKR